jgi:hypothetical protein
MTFLEAAMELLRQAGRPLHFKELTQRALKTNLLTHVGKTPEIAMQARLAQEAKKGHRTPLIRVSPGIFGLRVYDAPHAVEAPPPPVVAKETVHVAPAPAPPAEGEDGKTRRRRRGRGRRADAGKSEKALALSDGASQGPEPGTPEEAIAAAKLAEEADGPAVEPAAARAEEAPTEVDLDALLPSVATRRGLLQIPTDESLAEYAEDAEGKGITAPVEGEVVDERTADEDRPMLEEIQAERKDRDRRKHRRRGREEGKRPAAEGTPRKAPPPPPARMPVASPPAAPSPGPAPSLPRSAPVGATPASSPSPTSTLADVAFQLLSSMSDTRPVHARQLAAMAHKRKLVVGDPEEAWKSLKVALLEDARACLGRGARPRVRHQGGGLFVLGTARLEQDLAQAEAALEERANGMARATRVALRQRLVRLPLPLLEQLVRVFLERTGVRGLERVKRVDHTAYLTGLSHHGVLPVRLLVAVRAGEEAASRRTVGELRAGVVAKQLDAGYLLCAAPIADEGERELRAPGALVTALDGDQLAKELIREGVGVVRVARPISYLDVDFFSELAE